MLGLSGPALAALLSVYFFWGGTFLAARFGLESIPPLVLTSARFLIAGVLIYVVEWGRGLAYAGRKEWANAAASGILLLSIGNGALVWGQQYIPSGISAVFPGMCPIWMVLMLWLGKKISRPNTATSIGLILGFIGIILLGGSVVATGGENYLRGVCFAITSSFAWAGGSVYSKLSVKPDRPLQWAAMQMLCGGSLLMIFALISGQWQNFNISDTSANSLFGLLYLIFCGSLLGYASYIWLLNNVSPAVVGTYAYVNPVFAIFVGWLFIGEKISLKEAAAAIIILVAVALITIGNGNDNKNRDQSEKNKK